VTLVLIGLFLVSAAIRLVSGPIPALALDVDTTGFGALSRYPAQDFAAGSERLERLLAVARTAAETDIAQLVSVYEAMKPKDTARIFAEMTPDFAAGFLARMQPEVAARVVAALDPEKAYSISVVLAGRNL